MDMETLERFAVKAADKLERDARQIGELKRMIGRGIDRALNWFLVITLAMIPIAFLLSGLQWLILAIFQ
ncbi:hypothetical protein [Guyparkeria sp.]|uniref:hypothetical protein n=1 Tax=Guyparkeria sp. TaxID=2035736 RepID=UPI0039709EF2